jgi:hypothetical protein
VAALHHRLEQHVRIVVAVEESHLRARHHDVAHLDVADAEHALEHRQRITLDDSAPRGLAQELDDFLAVLHLAGHAPRQLAQPLAAGPRVVGLFLGAHV